MNNLLENFEIKSAAAQLGPLEPQAKYFVAMDCLIYLTEDLSYRAVRLSPLVTVLLHPYEDRAVGVKVKGMRDVVERLRAILKGQNEEMTEDDVLQLLAVIELAFTVSMGDHLMVEADAERRRRYEPEVKRLAKQAGAIRVSELSIAA